MVFDEELDAIVTQQETWWTDSYPNKYNSAKLISMLDLAFTRLNTGIKLTEEEKQDIRITLIRARGENNVKIASN